MFDPYRKWLGIPEDQRPPTHYQLLGIAPDERDIEVIEAAVLRQSAFVRNFQAGQHADDATRLLNEISAARLCLVDKEKRAKYDAELRKKRQKTTAAPAARHSDSDLPVPAAAVVERPRPQSFIDLEQLAIPTPRRSAAAGRRLPGAGQLGRHRSTANVGYVWQVPLVTVMIILLMLLARFIGHSIAEQRGLHSRPAPAVEQPVEQPETE